MGAEITKAVRDVTIGGKKVNSGDYIAIMDHEIAAVSDSAENALRELLSNSVDIDEYEILTVFVGKEVSEERRAEITEGLEEEFPDLEITVYEGGQEVYDYLVALE
jgi:dihydroxyacetone kinase-like predicted kinase